jgi:hypothetical protein
MPVLPVSFTLLASQPNHNRLIEVPNPTGLTDQAILLIRRNVLVVEGAGLLWLVHEPVLTG